MAVFGVGATLAGLILSAALSHGTWLRDVDRALAHLECLLEGAGLFRSAEVSEAAGD